MALLFMDGFDHYATADILKKWSSTTSTPVISASLGRRGGGCLISPNNTSSQQNVIKTLLASYTTLIIGVAFFTSGFESQAQSILRFQDASAAQVTVRCNLDGTLSVVRGSAGGTVLATSVQTLPTASFSYIELKATIHSSTGAYELRVNGVTWVSGTGANTQSTANATTNQILVGPAASLSASLSRYYDDLYICDTSGSTNNDFLGDCRVDTLLPNADGTYTDFTPNSGSNHYSRVAEGAPDTTTYVTSSTVDQKDTYAFQDLTAVTGTIKGIQVNNAALKDDAGARSIANVVRSGTTDAVGSTVALSTSQLIYSSVHETDPNTSAAWTESGVNSMQAGVKVAA